MVRHARLRLERQLEVARRRSERGRKLGRCQIGICDASAARRCRIVQERPGAADDLRVGGVEHDVVRESGRGRDVDPRARDEHAMRRVHHIGGLECERELTLRRRRPGDRARRFVEREARRQGA